ncbi:MAG: glycoside hydrolase family 127 protein [Acidobacteriaceae bacterium]|nr:glycoside hydrolase family 127 protein [Acidobacteriaceae bacterium]
MIRLLCLFTLAMPMFADPPQPVIVNAVTDLYRPLPADQEKLGGVLGERIRAAREGYLENPAERSLFGSAGSQAGRFLEAAANAYDYSHDPNLKTAMDQVAKQVISPQSPADLSADGDKLLGLVAYYRVTGNQGALASARKVGDSLVDQWGKRVSTRNEASANVLAPMIYLYRYTGESRYLDFCKSVAGVLHEPAVLDQHLEEKLFRLMGLIELYRTTGDNAYYKPVVTTWAQLRSTSFPPLSPLTEEVTPCSLTLWIQLTLNLLRLTGQPQYGEELERLIYNQLFAAQDPKTGKSFASVPMNGVKTIASAADGCGANEAEGVNEIPHAVWGRYGRGLAIILYSSGRATFKLRRRGTIQLYAEAAYPSTGEILLHVEPDHDIQFPLRLRVPEWTKSFVADVDGTHLIGQRGEFLTIIREWKRGDTLKIAMDMTVRAIRNPGPEADEIAIQRGPQILALAKALNPGIPELAAAGPISDEPAHLALAPRDTKYPANWSGDQSYAIRGQYQGKPMELILVPFADAVNYRVFLKTAAAASRASDH